MLEARLRALATRAGLAVGTDRLGSLARREVTRILGSLFDLAADARLFLPREDVAYLLANPPADWEAGELALAAYLVKSGLLAADGERLLGPDEQEELLLRLALYLRVVEALDGTLLSLGDGSLRLRLEGEGLLVREIMTPAVYSVPEDLPVSRVAETMIDSHIHRLLVTRGTQVVGIITTSDLLGLLVDEE